MAPPREKNASSSFVDGLFALAQLFAAADARKRLPFNEGLIVMAITDPVAVPQQRLGLVGLIGMAATVGTAVAFQVLGGYLPCKLCYEQRIPYYVAMPIVALGVLLAFRRGPALAARLLLLLGGLLMLYGLYLAVYHAGVEWAFWPGPTDCGVAVDASTSTSGGVLDSLNAVIPPSCDKAALRVLGLSFAGWNAVASAILAAILLRAAWARGSR